MAHHRTPRPLPRLSCFALVVGISWAWAPSLDAQQEAGGGIRESSRVWGTAMGEHFGESVAWLGDNTGDGREEIAISRGAPPYKVWVYSGVSATLRWELDGRTVANAGDVNFDGVDDIVTGDPSDDAGPNGVGTVRIYSGADGALLRSFSGDTLGVYTLGAAVDSAGDLNGDGYAEIVAGAPGDASAASNPSWTRGSALVFSGIDGSVIYQWFGSGADDLMGAVVCGTGDANLDGVPDVLIGSDHVGAVNSGWGGYGGVELRSGADGALLWSVTGSAQYQMLGESVADSGDVDGDGRSDVFVGAPYAFPWLGAGSAMVLSGLDGSVIHTYTDPVGSAIPYALQVTAGRDVDGDRVPDQVVFGLPPATHGRIYLYSGATGAHIGTIVGQPKEQGLGAAMDMNGDPDGDRLGDLLLGAPSADSPTYDNVGVVSVRSVVPYLYTPSDEISLSDPMPFRLGIKFPQTEAEMPYVLLASLAGHGQTAVSGGIVPLADDALLQFMVGGGMPAFVDRGTGILDGVGRSYATIQLPPGAVGMIGQSVSIAVMTLDPGSLTARETSVARRLTVTP